MFFNWALLNTNLNFTYPTETLESFTYSYSGGTPSKSIPEYWDGDTLWASAKDIKQFYLTDTQDRISEQAVLDSSTKMAEENTVLIVVRSGILIHTLPVSVVKQRTAINQDLKAYITQDHVLPEYLAIFLNVFEKKLLPLIIKHSTTVQSINSEQFDKLPIPIPPKDIQVQIIEKYDKAIQQRNSAIEQARTLLSSIDAYLLDALGIQLPTPPSVNLSERVFLSNFSDIEGLRFDPFFHQVYYEKNLDLIRNSKYKALSLKEIAQKFIKGHLPKNEEKNGDCKVVQINCINQDGSISLEDDILTAINIFSDEQKLCYKDILIVITGATIGKIAFWDIQNALFYLGGDIIKFQCNENFEPYFVYEFLRSQITQFEIKRNITGATNKHLSPSDIEKLLIPLPPLSIQEKIATHIRKVRTEAQALKTKAEATIIEAKAEIERVLLA